MIDRFKVRNIRDVHHVKGKLSKLAVFRRTKSVRLFKSADLESFSGIECEIPTL